MKKIIVSSLLILSLGFGVHAFAGKGGEQHRRGDGGNYLPKLVQKLDLDEQQTAEIEKITAGKRDSMREQRKITILQMMALDPDASDYDAQVTALADRQAASVRASIIQQGKVKADVYAVLTDEQKTELRGLIAEAQERKGKKGH